MRSSFDYRLEHAISKLVNSISNSFGYGNFTLGIFIDFSKGFYTVDHTIILSKLNEYWGSSIKYVRKISQKTNISNPLIRARTCAYQEVRNVSFSANFAYVFNR